MMKETLAEYVTRIMHQKNLKPADVRENCGKKLSGSYILRVAKGTMDNLTIETILALAEGLEVSPHEIFNAACGEDETESKVDPLLLVDTMRKLVLNPQLIPVVHELAKFSPKQQVRVLESVKALNHETKGKSKKKT
jgi:transcriptional regulator with XRE-family HTH domain